jgi:hypothetical protein
VQQALALVEKLVKERRMSSDEAYEVATAIILAPADGPAASDDPPTPLSVEEQRMIRHSL